MGQQTADGGKVRSWNFRDLTGQTFGRLTVQAYAGTLKGRLALWRCACECGGSTIARAGSLLNGLTRSCGCLRRERTAARSRKHGEAGKTPEYRAWAALKSRNSGRMCERFRESFETFLADLGRRPAGAFLNRIQPERGYDCGRCPDCLRRGASANCRWAIKEEVRARGQERETLPLADWRRASAASLAV